jgi:hypothetical protein
VAPLCVHLPWPAACQRLMDRVAAALQLGGSKVVATKRELVM